MQSPNHRVLLILVVVLVVLLLFSGLYTYGFRSQAECAFPQSQISPTANNPGGQSDSPVLDQQRLTTQLESGEAYQRKIGQLGTDMPKLQSFISNSKDLIVHAVYYDDRVRCGHKNSSVFLVAVKKTILRQNLIIGCAVGAHTTSEFDAHLIGESYLMHMFFSHFTHEEILVNCFDLPVVNGSRAFIIYRKSNSSANVTLAESENRLMIPAPRRPPADQGKSFTILTCTKTFDRPPWIIEWLRYQKALGIDHVHMAADDSFVRAGGMMSRYIKQLISEGYLSITIWQNRLNGNEIWYHSQGLLLEDCIYRFRGTYDHVSILDTDDFFIPRIPGLTSMHYYVQRWCGHPLIGSCALRWINYYPDCGLTGEVGADGNVTSKLAASLHNQEFHPKSIHRLSVILDAATHYAAQLMIGYRSVEIPPDAAYVAHVRKSRQPPKDLLNANPGGSGNCKKSNK